MAISPQTVTTETAVEQQKQLDQLLMVAKLLEAELKKTALTITPKTMGTLVAIDALYEKAEELVSGNASLKIESYIRQSNEFFAVKRAIDEVVISSMAGDSTPLSLAEQKELSERAQTVNALLRVARLWTEQEENFCKIDSLYYQIRDLIAEDVNDLGLDTYGFYNQYQAYLLIKQKYFAGHPDETDDSEEIPFHSQDIATGEIVGTLPSVLDAPLTPTSIPTSSVTSSTSISSSTSPISPTQSTTPTPPATTPPAVESASTPPASTKPCRQTLHERFTALQKNVNGSKVEQIKQEAKRSGKQSGKQTNKQTQPALLYLKVSKAPKEGFRVVNGAPSQPLLIKQPVTRGRGWGRGGK